MASKLRLTYSFNCFKEGYTTRLEIEHNSQACINIGRQERCCISTFSFSIFEADSRQTDPPLQTLDQLYVQKL